MFKVVRYIISLSNLQKGFVSILFFFALLGTASSLATFYTSLQSTKKLNKKI